MGKKYISGVLNSEDFKTDLTKWLLEWSDKVTTANETGEGLIVLKLPQEFDPVKTLDYLNSSIGRIKNKQQILK